jgi:hypothetical protein
VKAAFNPNDAKPGRVRYNGKEKDIRLKARQTISIGPDL